MNTIREIILCRFDGDDLPRMTCPWQVDTLKQHCVTDKWYALCYSWQDKMPVLALYEIDRPTRCFPNGRFIIAFALPARINDREVNSEWACEALEERTNERYYELMDERHFFGHLDYAYP